MTMTLIEELAICWDLSRRGEPVTALARGLELWQRAKLARDDAAVAAASEKLGWFCLQIGEVEAGIDHAYAAKQFFAESGDRRRETWCRTVYAWLLLEAGLTEEAADEALKAVAEADHVDDPATMSWALNALAIVFWTCKQLERAQVLSERAVAIARSLDDPTMLGWWLINLSGIHSGFGARLDAQGDNDAAHRAFDLALSINAEALGLATQGGDGWGMRIALANAAEYLVATGALGEAETMLGRWEGIPVPCGARTAAQFFYTKGQLRARQGRQGEALADCANALSLAQQSRNTDSEAHALRYLSEIYESLGRFDTALAYFKKFHQAEERCAAEKTQRRARIAEIHYETERFKRLADLASQRADELALTNRLDALTGIGNRRALDERFARLRTGSSPFCIGVIDLDYFKRINDTFSHSAGDEVLRRVAGLLQSSIEADELVVRLGGEEFVVILEGADLEAAMDRAIRINATLAETSWSDLSPRLRVTASIGIASGLEALDPAAVMALADTRLYAAKAAGRNRVVGASAADPSGPLTAHIGDWRRSSHGKAAALRLRLA